jgi:hypothetical protein
VTWGTVPTCVDVDSCFKPEDCPVKAPLCSSQKSEIGKCFAAQPAGASCTDELQCESFKCEASKCAALAPIGGACEFDEGCSSGRCVLGMMSSVCSQKVPIGGQCNDSIECESGRCGPSLRCALLSNISNSCERDYDCAFGNSCGPKKKCIPQCDLCTTSGCGGCKLGLKCYLAFNSHPAVCGDLTNCFSHDQCDPTSSFGCRDEICVGKAMSGSKCLKNLDCESGMCSDFACAVKLEDGQNCKNDADCQSDACDLARGTVGVCVCNPLSLACTERVMVPPIFILNATSNTSVVVDSNPNSSCFPADAIVELFGGIFVTMSHLAVGDTVRVSRASFSKVILFTHSDESATTEFVRIETSSGQTLSASPGHYVYSNSKMIIASDVKEGDVMYDERPTGNLSTIVTVTKTSRERKQGLYNPHTIDGDIVVNGLRTSTFTAAISPLVGKLLLFPLKVLSTRFDIHLPHVSTYFVDGASVLDPIFKYIPWRNDYMKA